MSVNFVAGLVTGGLIVWLFERDRKRSRTIFIETTIGPEGDDSGGNMEGTYGIHNGSSRVVRVKARDGNGRLVRFEGLTVTSPASAAFEASVENDPVTLAATRIRVKAVGGAGEAYDLTYSLDGHFGEGVVTIESAPLSFEIVEDDAASTEAEVGEEE